MNTALVMLLALAPVALCQVPFTSHEVMFLSSAPSGNMTLTGTLLLPVLNRLVGGKCFVVQLVRFIFLWKSSGRSEILILLCSLL